MVATSQIPKQTSGSKLKAAKKEQGRQTNPSAHLLHRIPGAEPKRSSSSLGMNPPALEALHALSSGDSRRVTPRVACCLPKGSQAGFQPEPPWSARASAASSLPSGAVW